MVSDENLCIHYGNSYLDSINIINNYSGAALKTYELLSLISGCIAFGMVLGGFVFNRFLKNNRDTLQITNMKLQTEIKMADLSLASSRNANEACYDLGFKDGKTAQIKELGKAMLSESVVLKDGLIVQSSKLGPKKGAA